MNVRKNLVANLLGQGWSALLNLATVPIYLRVLGVESFGLIGFGVTVLVLVSLLDGGIAITLNRKMVHFKAGKSPANESADLLRSSEVAMLAIAACASLLAVLLSPSLAHWLFAAERLPADTVAQAIAMIMVVSLLRVVEAIYRAALLGLDRSVTANSLAALSATLRVLGPLPFILYQGGGVLTYFWVQLAISIVSTLAFAGTAHTALEGSPIGNGRFRPSLLRDSLAFAGAAFAISSLTALANQTDKLFAARLSTLEAFGYYSAAATVATGIYQLVLPVFQSFFPKFSFLHAAGDHDGFDRLYTRMGLMVGFIAGVPIAVILLYSYEVLVAWTGNAQVAAATAPLLFALCFGALANGLFYVSLAALLAAGRHKIAVHTTLGLMAVLIPLLLLGWKWERLPGLAAAWSAAMSVWCLVTLVLATAAVTVRHWRNVVQQLALCLAPFAVALCAGSGLRWVWDFHPGTQLAEAVVIVVTSGIVAALTGITLWLCALVSMRFRDARS